MLRQFCTPAMLWQIKLKNKFFYNYGFHLTFCVLSREMIEGRLYLTYWEREEQYLIRQCLSYELSKTNIPGVLLMDFIWENELFCFYCFALLIETYWKGVERNLIRQRLYYELSKTNRPGVLDLVLETKIVLLLLMCSF